MEILGAILMIIGAVGLLVGGVWFLATTFQEGIVWGLACIFVPFVALVFLVMHWDRAGKPFLIQVASLVPLFLGAFLASPQA